MIAVRLDLDTDGFVYRKWGAEQKCKSGDWLIDNEGDIYTIDQDVFTRTYRKVGAGKYVKTTPVWAEVAKEDGHVTTKEGASHYKAGDYLVYNDKDGIDGYCTSAAKFESMYELDE